MPDDRMMRDYRGHTHHRHRYSTSVVELDGGPVAVSVDDGAVLWTCDLRGGDCVSVRLDLDAAGPDDSWYIENEYWDEYMDEDERENPRGGLQDRLARDGGASRRAARGRHRR